MPLQAEGKQSHFAGARGLCAEGGGLPTAVPSNVPQAQPPCAAHVAPLAAQLDVGALAEDIGIDPRATQPPAGHGGIARADTHYNVWEACMPHTAGAGGARPVCRPHTTTNTTTHMLHLPP